MLQFCTLSFLTRYNIYWMKKNVQQNRKIMCLAILKCIHCRGNCIWNDSKKRQANRDRQTLYIISMIHSFFSIRNKQTNKHLILYYVSYVNERKKKKHHKRLVSSHVWKAKSYFKANKYTAEVCIFMYIERRTSLE